MKFLLTTTLALFAFGALAADDLNTLKSDANQRIDDQMSALQSSKTCVNGATTVDAFKACKVDSGTTVQKQEEVIRTESVEKKDSSLGDQVKEEYKENKEKLDDAM